ncbi:MAG: hypothetical protein KA731_02040 [Candidatus Moranbacteria bacterium]|nr:hypothetical protein [Candidatus Moranbacteria bacterium]MBP7696014.1 hypothetical protein [Candidatus Moranbacteria bacterium]
MRVISAACLMVVCGLFISAGSVSAGVPNGGACPSDPSGVCQNISSCTGFVNMDAGCDSGDCCTGGSTTTTTAGGGAATCPMGTALENGICIPTSTGLSRGDTTILSTTIAFFTLSIRFICSTGPVACVLATFMNWSLSIIGLIAIISFVLAGFQYLMAFGEPKALEKAKNHVRWSVIGVLVALSGMVVIYAVDGLLAGYSRF